MTGITYADIELIRAADLILVQEGYLSADQIHQVQVSALVDSGASMLTIPRSLARLLNLQKMDEVQTELANGEVMQAEVVGPIEVRFANRRASVRSEEHTSELQSRPHISYAVFCLKKKNNTTPCSATL